MFKCKKRRVVQAGKDNFCWVAKLRLIVSPSDGRQGCLMDSEGTLHHKERMHWNSKWKLLDTSLLCKVSQGLRAILLELYDKHLSEEGKSVDYSGLAKDELFKQFEVAATEMQQIDVAPLSRSERIAFFLNVYNILVVHSHARLSPPSNFIQR